MTIRDEMARLSGALKFGTRVALLGLGVAALVAPAAATPAESAPIVDDAGAADVGDHGDGGFGDDGAVILAHHQPPPPPQPIYVYPPPPPPPRRVYVEPSYEPQPRRPVEQLYRPRFNLAFTVAGTSILDDSDSIARGLGTGLTFGISGGYRFGSAFALDFGWTGNFHETKMEPLGSGGASIHALTVDGRIFLSGWNQRLQPYLQAGVGVYWVQHEQAFAVLTGGGFQLGGGFDFYLTRSVSIGGKLLYRGAWVDNSFNTPVWEEITSTWLSMFTYGADIKFHF